MNIVSPVRIWAVMMRHILLQFRDLYRIFDITFWPLLDITLWGFVGSLIQPSPSAFIPLVFLPVLGAIFWQIVIRGSVEIAVNFMEEIWSKNLSNLFSSPLLFSEWIIALMLLSVFRMAVVFVLSSIVIWFAFGCNVLLFGWWLIPIALLLLISGWSLGFISVALVLRWGQRVQNFSWAIGWAFAAFCGVFYSIDVLPTWMQIIGKSLPMTYTFKALHGYAATGTMPTHFLFTSLWLNILFFVIIVLFLHFMFRKATTIGLARLEVD